MTPSSTRASTRSARQTAYCPPRKNPFVPSIGSNVQNPKKKNIHDHDHHAGKNIKGWLRRNARPVRPPGCLPLSMAFKSASAPHRLPRPHSARSPPPSPSLSPSIPLGSEEEGGRGGCAKMSSASSTTRARSAAAAAAAASPVSEEEARRSEASSSPMMGSSGKACERTVLMTACAA